VTIVLNKRVIAIVLSLLIVIIAILLLIFSSKPITDTELLPNQAKRIGRKMSDNTKRLYKNLDKLSGDIHVSSYYYKVLNEEKVNTNEIRKIISKYKKEMLLLRRFTTPNYFKKQNVSEYSYTRDDEPKIARIYRKLNELYALKVFLLYRENDASVINETLNYFNFCQLLQYSDLYLHRVVGSQAKYSALKILNKYMNNEVLSNKDIDKLVTYLINETDEKDAAIYSVKTEYLRTKLEIEQLANKRKSIVFTLFLKNRLIKEHYYYYRQVVFFIENDVVLNHLCEPSFTKSITTVIANLIGYNISYSTFNITENYFLLSVEKKLAVVNLMARQYYLDHGVYPACLEALGLAPKEIEDVFANKMKIKYNYNSKIIYSVGLDRIDNGGQNSNDIVVSIK